MKKNFKALKNHFRGVKYTCIQLKGLLPVFRFVIAGDSFSPNIYSLTNTTNIKINTDDMTKLVVDTVSSRIGYRIDMSLQKKPRLNGATKFFLNSTNSNNKPIKLIALMEMDIIFEVFLPRFDVLSAVFSSAS